MQFFSVGDEAMENGRRLQRSSHFSTSSSILRNCPGLKSMCLSRTNVFTSDVSFRTSRTATFSSIMENCFLDTFYLYLKKDKTWLCNDICMRGQWFIVSAVIATTALAVISGMFRDY